MSTTEIVLVICALAQGFVMGWLCGSIATRRLILLAMQTADERMRKLREELESAASNHIR